MPDSGSGVGTPVPTENFIYDQMTELVFTPNCAVSLSRYAKLIGYSESSFWGVVVENSYLYGCDPLWSETQRSGMQYALAEAQQQIEQIIGYPLCPTYISGVYDDNPRWVDQQPYCSRQLITRYPRILAVGIPVVSVIESDSVIDYSGTDGVGVIGPLATAATHTYEIKIYYPDSDREITPSKITLSGGNVTIEIPRYRMVKQEFLNVVEGGVDYMVLGNFLTTVDVKRIYTDSSTQAILVRPNCRNGSCVSGCYECTQTACIYLRDAYLGIIDVTPATWNEDLNEWRTNIVCRGGYSIARLYYLAGMRSLSLQAEIAVIRLAHTLLGNEPCSCPRTSGMWQRDRDMSTAITRERVNNPLGPSLGAYTAYKWALSIASKRASIL